jgi:hypothetical protein
MVVPVILIFLVGKGESSTGYASHGWYSSWNMDRRRAVCSQARKWYQNWGFWCMCS